MPKRLLVSGPALNDPDSTQSHPWNHVIVPVGRQSAPESGPEQHTAKLRPAPTLPPTLTCHHQRTIIYHTKMMPLPFTLLATLALTLSTLVSAQGQGRALSFEKPNE